MVAAPPTFTLRTSQVRSGGAVKGLTVRLQIMRGMMCRGAHQMLRRADSHAHDMQPGTHHLSRVCTSDPSVHHAYSFPPPRCNPLHN